jgi:dsRNA-specific ribonuclease
MSTLDINTDVDTIIDINATTSSPSKSLGDSIDRLFDALLGVAPRAIRDPISHAYISATFGYNFKNLDLLNEAFDTTGFYPARPDKTKRMALIGDSVIQTILVRDRFPTGQTKGMQTVELTCMFMTRLTRFTIGAGNLMLQAIASNAKMAQVARRIGLGGHLVLNPGLRAHEPSDYMLATALEVVFGAINSESGESASVVRAAMNQIGLTAASKDEENAM